MFRLFSPRYRLPTAAIMLGGVVAGLSYQEQLIVSSYQEDPTETTCSQLAGQGHGDNIHITLTDFQPCENGYVYYEYKLSDEWRSVYIPVYPAEAEGEPSPEELRVILHLVDAKNEAEAWQQLDSGRLTGIVESKGDNLLAPKRMLREFYPGMDFSHCWVVRIGGRTPSPAMAKWGLPCGIAAAAVGLIWIAVCLVKPLHSETDRTPLDDVHPYSDAS